VERLWEITSRENIKVRYEAVTINAEGIYGLYIFDNEIGPVIVLDEQLHSFNRLHKCVLAHEIGHFYTSPRTNILSVHPSSNDRAIESQDERKAMQWATDFLIPDRELDHALAEGYRSCFELAEYFDVTEWFVYRKLNLLRMCFRRAGLKVKCRDMFDIKMQPCNVIG